jgi:thymidylate kinase
MTTPSANPESANSMSRSLRRPRRRSMTVALVGADGAGKSTMCRAIETADLPAAVKTIYMGVNLEASSLMLPTTRLLVAVKRRRGGRPDMVATSLQSDSKDSARSLDRARRAVRDTARLAAWTTEEWLRLLVAAAYKYQGNIVVFDRHFLADYAFVGTDGAGQTTWGAKAHVWMLRHVYPKPDLMICLDAPADVLYARKPESSVEWLEQRRQQYLRLGSLVSDFVVVDVDRPFAEVKADVVRLITTRWRERST